MPFAPMTRLALFVALLGGFAAPARAQDSNALLAQPRTGWSAPALHVSLATAFAGLQALDTATTLHSVRTGTAVEANPLMGDLAKHPAALVGVKAGLTTATILSMRALSRNHPKAAVLTMIALNAGSAFVVGSNFRVTR